MRRYSLFHVPAWSFFSKGLYIDIGLYWKGLNFLYLLGLLAVCWLPTMIKAHSGLADFIDNDAAAVVNQVPEITITDGVVSIEETQPYYIRKLDSNEPLAIIDTTGQIESLEGTDAFCLLTSNKLITKKSEVESSVYDLSELKAFSVDSERISGWSHIVRNFLIVVMYPFAVLGSYVYRIVQVLIYAAIGLLFASLCKTTISYAALIRLAVAAVTPCIIVGTILGLVGSSIPSFLYLLAALAYLFFAVKSIAGMPVVPEEAPPAQPDFDQFQVS